MNPAIAAPRHRSPRTVFLRFLPILGVILVDLFFLAMLDNLFYNKKRALIMEPSELREAMFDEIEPIREGLLKLPTVTESNQRKEQCRQFIEKNAPPILDRDNPWFRIELSDGENRILFEKENPEKFRHYNNASNCFISRSFKAITTTKIRDAVLNVTFFYASPQGWRSLESMVVRYWIYAGLFIAASWAVFVWLLRAVLRPLERVGQAIEAMIQSGQVILIQRPNHAIEHQFNRLARNQREVLLGLEIERLVDELHSLTDDTEVVERFLCGVGPAVCRIYPFQEVWPFVYSSSANQLVPLLPESPPWPETNPAGKTVDTGICTVVLNAGDSLVGALHSRSEDKSLPQEEWEAMVGEIKKQMENGLARAFTRSRALTEERNRFGINLATNMGHDLTNIIASGKWDLDTIQRVQNMGFVVMDPQKGTFFLEAVEGLRNNLHFLQEMVDIYRSFGYTRRPSYERISLPELIQQVATLFRLSTSQKLSVELCIQEPVELTAEPRLLRMAVFNLMANAAQAIRRSDPRMQGRIVLSVDRGAETNATLSICDNGPGIRDRDGQLLKERELRRIFQSGFSTKENSSGGGLGLAWVKSIVEDFHNGHIEAVNRPEGGAQFTIVLPLCYKPPDSESNESRE